MARIQISELSSVETQMEDLSYDVAGNIAGGGFLSEVGSLIDQLLVFATLVTELCSTGALNPEICDRIF